MTNPKEHKEIVLTGSPGSPGLVLGKAMIYNRENPVISSHKIGDEDVAKQINRFKKARKRAVEELELLLKDELDENAVELIQAQIEMINDPDLNDRITAMIENEKRPADYAVQQVFDEFLDLISQRDNSRLMESAVDISDVRDRLIQIVNNQQSNYASANDHIVVAEELSPREVIELAEYDIKGIVMDHGGSTSHAAIIARAINIPAVVGVKSATKCIDQEKMVIIDGDAGRIIISPNKNTHSDFRKRVEEQQAKLNNYQNICQKPSLTEDGTSFILRANVEFEEELDNVEKFCAEGIGLLRTESIYLHRDRFGDQEKQESFYKTILEGTADNPVTIRLFDAGGDKFFNIGSKEPNPFLGWRGIRMLLDKQSLLQAQLRAILKVSAEFPGRIRILVPMISCLEEIIQLKEAMQEVKKSLQDDGVEVDDRIQLGIMVEVPSVAIKAKTFARHVDFMSIGTNDLTQYVMAVDRGNELITRLYDQRYPAIWELINTTAQVANDSDIGISVCGELASDPVAACCLMGMGISDLSMSPASIPAVKSLLMQKTLPEMQQLSKKVLGCNTLEEIRRLFENWKTNNSN